MAIGNNGSRMVGATEFYGGLSTDNKIGIENSFADGECLDVRKSPSQMTVLPMARQLPDSGTITGLMTAMTQSRDGNIWGIDEDGKVYKIDENNSITSVSTTAQSSGFSLEVFDLDDGLWWADAGHKLFSYGRVLNPTGAPVETTEFEFLDDNSPRVQFAVHVIQDEDVFVYNSDQDIRRSDGTQTCAVPTSVDETTLPDYGSANIRKFAGLYLPGRIPVAKIGIRFMAKGTGTVRLEIHDERDNVVASSLPMNATDVSTSGYTVFNVAPDPSSALSPSNQFTFMPWSGNTMESGSVFHIHIVASTSGYTVKTSTANDMSLTLDFTSTAYILHETFNGKHPMAIFSDLYIGNGQYVSKKVTSPLNGLDDTLFIQNALRLDDGFEVCSFGLCDEYLMVGAEKYSAGSKRGFQAGRIYFWDMSTDSPSFTVECNMGAPKAIFNYGNIVYIIASGALYAYTGGKELVKVRTLKGTDTEYSGRNSLTEVYPNMMTVRREILLIGFPSHTEAYSIRHGIHAFGSVDKNYPNCFTYNYKIPGATPSQTLEQYNSDEQGLRIGCVYNFGDSLFYSYEVEDKTRNTKRVALAVVDNDSGTSTSFMWKSLQYDAGSPYFQKQGLRIGIYFDPLPANTTIRPMYRLDDGEWEEQSDIYAKEGDRQISLEINERFHELQYGFVGTTGNDLLTPVIKQVSAEIRVLNEEAKL